MKKKKGKDAQHIILLVNNIQNIQIQITELKEFLKVINKCLSATLDIFCVRVDNRHMDDVFFSNSLFMISTYKSLLEN